jgi:hypothetical protein
VDGITQKCEPNSQLSRNPSLTLDGATHDLRVATILGATLGFGRLFGTAGEPETASSKASSGPGRGRAGHTVRGYISVGGEPLAVVFFMLRPSYMWY